MYIHHTHAVTSTKKRNIARSLNRWLINQPSFSSVFIHESRGDARHCGSRAGKLSPSRDTTVFTPSKHNGLSRFPVFFFPFFFLVISSTNIHYPSLLDTRKRFIFETIELRRWRQNSKVLSHTSVSLPASPLSPRPLLFLFPIHLTFPLRLPSFPFIKARGGCWSLKEGATGSRRAPWHAYSRVRQT